jgi:hypothetical protein
MINVWTSNEKREEIVRRLLLTDKTFKLTSLQVNPVYKPVFDRLDAIAIKELQQLDKSILWSRHYTKAEFKHTFLYPLFVFIGIIFVCISYGVKYRLYSNYIRYGRELGLSGHLNIDLEDISQYPKSVLELYQEKKKHEAY